MPEPSYWGGTHLVALPWPAVNLPTGQIDTTFAVFQHLRLTFGGAAPSWVVERLRQGRPG